MSIKFGSIVRSPKNIYRFLHRFKVAAVSDCFCLFLGRLLGTKGFIQYLSCTEKQPVTGKLKTNRDEKCRKFHRPATLL